MNKNFYLCIVRKKIFYNNIPSINLRQRDLSEWIHECVEGRGAKVKRLSINFIKEGEMLDLNRKHLNHDEHTDILTFSYKDQLIIESEIFISFERARENAKNYSETVENEILRLISHGLLHIFGMRDSTKAMKAEMTKQENSFMKKFHVKHTTSEKAI